LTAKISKRIGFVLIIVTLLFLVGCGGGGGSGRDSSIPDRLGSSLEICNGYDDNGDGIVDEGDVCEVNVYICKTNNFDEASEECADGEWGSDSTEEGKLSVNYMTKEGDVGRKEFYTYVCDAYFEDGDYGCYYFVKGEFSVGDIVCNDDGIRDGNEECDGDDLDGKDCEYYGYGEGVIKCSSCMFDFSNCNDEGIISGALITGGFVQQPLEFDGYIVELSEKPLVDRYIELKGEIDQKKAEVDSVDTDGLKVLYNGPIKAGKWARLKLLEARFDGKMERHEGKISEEQSEFPKKVEQSITGSVVQGGKEFEISGQFKNLINGVFVEGISEDEAEDIGHMEGVVRVHPNYQIPLALGRAVPFLGVPQFWREGITGKGIDIAILDTGVDYNHIDLGGCFGPGCKVKGGYDFVDNDNNPMDGSYHGTMVAGVIAGGGKGWIKSKGVAPEASLYAYRVCNNHGRCSYENIIKGSEAAVDPNGDGIFSDHMDVVSMSFGGGTSNPDSILALMADRMVDIGVVVVASAGNRGPNPGTVGCPSCSRKAISVGAYSIEENKIADFSSRGPVIWESNSLNKPDIVAPGVNIVSPYSGNNYARANGTSLATPFVTGAAALLLQAHPSLSPLEVKQQLMYSSVDIGYDINSQGAGLLNVANLLSDQTSLFVSRFYRHCLGREPDLPGLRGWVNAIKTGQLSGSDVARGFVFSEEFINKNVPNEEFVRILYKAFFNREPDAPGFNGWVSSLNSGKSREFVLNGFLNSQEFRNLCTEFNIRC